MDFAPCVKWVKKGVARSEPKKIELSRNELVELIRDMKTGDSDQDEAMDDEGGSYNWDQYDEEPENYSCSMNLGSVYHASDLGQTSDPDTDDEDDKIEPDDNLVLLGRGMRDSSGMENLEVHVYNDIQGVMYPHHDIMLPSCPLCLELVDVRTEDESSTLIAVGLMSGTVELYDLNIINPAKPEGKLGSKKNTGHKDAALDISWNTLYPHILASSSADKTVLLWDLEEQSASNKFDCFNGNVENIDWDKSAGHLLLCSDSSGGVKLMDCRMLETASEWSVKGEAPVSRWSSTNSNCFYVGSSKGYVRYFDIRYPKHLFKMKAHESEVTGICSIPGYNDLLLTICVTGDINLWDVTVQPQTLAWNKTLNVEQLHCIDLNPDKPLTAAVGGANKKGAYFSVINLNKNKTLNPLLDFRKIQS